MASREKVSAFDQASRFLFQKHTMSKSSLQFQPRPETKAKPQRDQLNVVFTFDENWNIPNGLAADGRGHWFLFKGYWTSDEIPRSDAAQVSLAEACRWYAQCQPFSESSNGTLQELLADVAKELERQA
jgi:hypothetical protein